MKKFNLDSVQDHGSATVHQCIIAFSVVRDISFLPSRVAVVANSITVGLYEWKVTTALPHLILKLCLRTL